MLWRSSSGIQLAVSLENRLITVPAFVPNVFVWKLPGTGTLDVVSCRGGGFTWGNSNVLDWFAVAGINVSLLIDIADLTRWRTAYISD
jgi:hypothetical protein